MGQKLFNTGAQHLVRSDIVSLPAFEEDGWWYKKYTSSQQVVRMRELLVDGISHLHEKLPLVPALLAITVPPYAHAESDTSLWLDKHLLSDWGNCVIDLVEHFSEHCIGRETAVYKLAGYIAYEGDEDVTPTWTFISGHFVSYFREGDDWYKADDSTVTPTGMGGAPPTAFPYICLFERVDLEISLPWPPMNFEIDETENAHDELDNADEGEESVQAGRGSPIPKRRRFADNARVAYESLCRKTCGGFPERSRLSSKKILAHHDLEAIIKLTRSGDFDKGDPTTRLRPSSQDKTSDYNSSLCHSNALPEAFFHDERHDLDYLFRDLGETVNAMRRIVRVLPRGEGLRRATRAYFGL